MKIIQKQQGKSLIVLVIILALIGVGVYAGLQYIPYKMEMSSVDSILDSIEKTYEDTQPKNIAEVKSTLNKYLTINQKQELLNNFKVTKENGEYTIEVNLVRDLNLLYKKTSMQYDREIYF